MTRSNQGKERAKGKDKNRYQELKAEVQKKFRVDKQQELESMCAELEAANAKENSRQVFQVVKSMTRKFQPRLQCIQSATSENLTEAAQIADRWKGYCEDFYHDKEGNGTEQEYWEKERAYTTSFRGCSCDPSHIKSKSHSRTVQSRRRDSTGRNAQNMCDDLGNW